MQQSKGKWSLLSISRHLGLECQEPGVRLVAFTIIEFAAIASRAET